MSQARRDLIAVPEPKQGTSRTLNAGELTYLLTVCAEQYREDHGDRFQTFADIVAALECAKQEFYRRVVSPYEDDKCGDQGDCYASVDIIKHLVPVSEEVDRERLAEYQEALDALAERVYGRRSCWTSARVLVARALIGLEPERRAR